MRPSLAHTRSLALAAILGVAPLSAAQAVAQPADQPADQPETVESPAAEPAEITDADALLSALETADAGINTLTSPIVYRKYFEIQSDTQTRSGTL